MREAYAQVSLPLPFERAMQLPAIATCVRCLAHARALRRKAAGR